MSNVPAFMLVTGDTVEIDGQRYDVRSNRLIDEGDTMELVATRPDGIDFTFTFGFTDAVTRTSARTSR